MIAQLMAQRMLALDPECEGAQAFKQAIRLCSNPATTLPQLAGMQAALAVTNASPDLRDLCQRALSIRRATLAAAQPKVSFSIGGRGKLVGA